jgi:hypothetical protein
VAHDHAFSERRMQILRELLTSLSLVLSVLCCLFFMLAMHFIVTIVAPAAIYDTAIVLIISVVSVGIGVVSSLPTTHQTRIFGIAVMVVMLYFVIALTISFTSDYPGLYTAAFAVFGVFGTSRMLGGFVAGNKLFANIPLWKRRPDKFPEEMIRRRLLEFDRRIKYNARTVISMTVIFSIGVVLALSSVENTNSRFLVFGAPFLWIASVLFVHTRIIIRMKRMFVDGFRVEERHIIQPLMYTAIASVIVLVVAGVLARDASILHYSVFIRLIENIFGIQHDRDASIGYPTFGMTLPGSQYAGSGPPATSRTAMTNLRPFAFIFRYLVLGGAIAATVVYIVVSILRMRSAGRHPAQSFRRRMRRGKSWLRYALVRAVRIWRIFIDSFRSMLRLRHRWSSSERGKTKSRKDTLSDPGAIKRIERNSVLRWHQRLLVWGRKHGMEAPWAATADEYLELIASAFPEHAEAIIEITGVFDDAFYSRVPVGRGRLRGYIRCVKTILKT